MVRNPSGAMPVSYTHLDVYKRQGKATEMAITATAQLVGAGLAAKAAVKAVQYASKIGRVAQKVLPKVERAAAAANCFVAGTQILMADGTSKNIEDIRVGDHVTSTCLLYTSRCV